jgi:hypothetical protein
MTGYELKDQQAIHDGVAVDVTDPANLKVREIRVKTLGISTRLTKESRHYSPMSEDWLFWVSH